MWKSLLLLLFYFAICFVFIARLSRSVLHPTGLKISYMFCNVYVADDIDCQNRKNIDHPVGRKIYALR